MSLCKCYYNYKLFENCCAIKIHESNNNEQLSDEQEQQLPEQEDQILDQIEEHEEQQIPDNTFLIENLKKAIKDSNLNDLFLNEIIYKDIVNSLLTFEEKNELQDERKRELNNRITDIINETENIDSLNDNQIINNLIKRTDITFYEKNLLQQNRKVKLDKLQQDLLQYYKEIIDQTDILSQLLEIQIAIGNENHLTAEQKVILFDILKEKMQKKTEQNIINMIQEKIKNTNEIINLQVDIKDEIDFDKFENETKNQTYDLLLDLICNSENINDISFDSEISQDIQTLNQMLLTRNRNVILLENIRRQNYNNELYDILKTAIEEEKDIEKLKNTWLEAINKLEQEYLTNDRNKLILQQLLNKRIEELQQPIEVPKQPSPERPQAKRPIEEVENNYPTTNPDKAEPNRNLAGSVEKQILDIISQYRKTLSAEDLRKYFSRTKIKPVTDIITNVYNTSRDKCSLLDVLYYKWVLGKDDSFLFEKRYKLSKINKTTKLIDELNNFFYYEELLKKKMIITINRLKKRVNYRKLRKHPMIMVLSQIPWQNPLGFPEEKVDTIASVNIIINKYKKSLADIFEITQKNIDIIQQTLSNMMLNYNTENKKKEFLDVVTKVLINADLEIEDIKHEEIKKMFYSFDFNF
ncbi:4969_t:CDS:2 [Cetraspora pellucida]|uniref:4969_t:CDS:1 n=1 Tax=Cetraspora pellucida TaxID=1433469 RepID=A0ACA9N2J3_9GLOM|nr:4969_t:CDS:2 [Cetraspora pellucida]